MRTALGLALLVALVVAAPALASERHPTSAELEAELVCPTCKTTLDQSTAPVAERMKQIIRERIAAGDSKSEIKASFVAQFGPAVLATPGRKGFDLVAWLLPLVGAFAAALAVGLVAWRWSRRRGDEPEPADAIDPELDRRVDAELERYE